MNLSLQQADLRGVLFLLAKNMHQNLVLSPSVQGMISMHIENASANALLDAVLMSQQLSKVTRESIVWVATQQEVDAYYAASMKAQQLERDSAPLEWHMWKLRYARAAQVVSMMRSGSQSQEQLKMHADDRSNLFYLQSTSRAYQAVDRIIRQLDVPVPHVLIEARIVSLDEGMESQLGLEWQSAQRSSDRALKQPGHYSFSVTKLASDVMLDVTLSMLEKAGHAELISMPSLYAASREPASIEAGEEVPYQESSESGGTTIVFKKAVLGLQVTPEVLPKQRILLKLKLNQDRPSHQMVLGMPTINTRQIMTSILVRSGQTIVLGGIREESREQSDARVPWLTRLPVIGWLFKQRASQLARRNLIIFVTPTILS